MMSIRKKFAFTIIEVLVVVAIIGTLIAIGLNEYSSSLNTTRTVTFRENVSAIEDCLNVYFSVNHRYPDTLEEIRGCLNKTPINPFTNEDMLTDGSITYTPLDDNLEYVIVVHQPDEDDCDDDGNTTEPIIEPPVLLSENIHLIVHPAGAGTAKAHPNPADSGVVVALSSQAGQCYNFNSWQPLSEITINSPTSSNTTFIMPGNEVSIVSKFDIKRYRVTLTSPGGEEVLGAGEYNCGEQVTVQAIPLTGHYFVGWYSGNTLVSTSPYYTFRIYSDVSLEARFAYYITLYANPTIGGAPTVSPNPAAYKTTVTLSANPDICYNFSGWTSPDITITGSTFVMPAKNVSVTANYTVKKYPIAVNIKKTGKSPNTPGTATGARTYDCGSTATLIATPAPGFNFTGWYEGSESVTTATTYSFTVNSTRTLEARFNAIPYSITMKSNPSGAGTPAATPNPAYVGQTVTLSRNPGSDYNFSNWSVSAGSLSDNTLTMPAQNVTVTANYTIKTPSNPPVTYYILSTAAVPSPGAHILPSTSTHAPGTIVNVSGWCDSEYDWVGFSVKGASCPSGASSCSITMNNDVYVEAHCQKRVSPLYATVNCSASPSTAGTCQACIGSTCGSRGSSSSVSVPCTSGSSFNYTTNPVGGTSKGQCYYPTSPSTGSVGCNSTKDVTLSFTLGMCQN